MLLELSLRIKIISNGNPAETKIVNAETGETLVGVVEADVMITPFETTAVLIFNEFEAHIETDNVIEEKQQNSQ
jgi:hypothetical protein